MAHATKSSFPNAAQTAMSTLFMLVNLELENRAPFVQQFSSRGQSAIRRAFAWKNGNEIHNCGDT